MAATNGTDVDIRVQDYLNDKLQTEADLQNVDALLQNVQHQQELLKIQVSERPHSIPLLISCVHSSRKPTMSWNLR